MNEHVVIEDVTGNQDLQDISFLKEKGLDLIKDLSGKVWTDHNTHDPGITILEVLCFAITELGYRTDYDISELIKFPVGSKNRDSFYSAHEILTSSSITLNDIKKQILDLGQIKNVEFFSSSSEPEFSGVYDIGVELIDASIDGDEKENISDGIYKLLENERNISTSFGEIFFLDFDSITLDLEIEVNERISYSEFVYQVISTIEEYFSPSPIFHSTREIKALKLEADYFYNGPLLKHGYILNEELSKHQIRKTIYVSDMISALMKVSSAKLIRKIHVEDQQGETYNWLYHVTPGKVPHINFEKSSITLYFNGGVVYESSLYMHGNRTKFQKLIRNSPLTYKDEKSATEIKNLKEYYSIQNNFPDTYGIGDFGAPPGADDRREAYIKQLKSYLTIFDQILSNYFAQLDHIKHLFSLEDITRTTQVQLISRMPGIEYVYKPFIEKYIQNQYDLDDSITLKREWGLFLQNKREELENFIHGTVEDELTFLNRRNLILDHLLARFGYNVQAFEYVSGFDANDLITYKLNLLRNIHTLSARKNKGGLFLNYLKKSGLALSGAEMYLYKHLGIESETKKSLTTPINDLLSGKEEGIVGDLKIDVPAPSLSEAVERLLYFGKDKERYIINRDGSIYIKVDDATNVEIKGADTFNKFDTVIEEIALSIKSTDNQSEGLHFIEHLQLRPTPDMLCFGFKVVLNNHAVLASAANLDKATRDKGIKLFQKQAHNAELYEIKELGYKQFKIIWKFKDFELTGIEFFDSFLDAEQAKNRYFRYLSDVGNVHETIGLTTKYEDLYNELEDPFSNILTILLPTWPSRFQNSAFKKYINQFIAESMPVHNIVNICWLNFEQMKEFEYRYDSYMDTSDPVNKELELSKLLTLLLSY